MITPRRVNLRTPEVMADVQTQVESHYRSELVEQIRAQGGVLKSGNTVIRLAKQFGFCYGVERAIDLAYAARKVFPEQRIFLLGEIIHNPDVNAQMAALGIEVISARPDRAQLDALRADDVVIVPAFGAEVSTVEAVRAAGCQIVDTTCGDVMSVWKRVRQNANEQVTSIIHGKANHEETRATASRALGPDGLGHYLIVLDLEQTDRLCDFIRSGGDGKVFLEAFPGAHSPGFDPTIHLSRVGVANQTTMLRSETEEIQRRVREAIAARDGDTSNYRHFDTICGATQERQDALFELMKMPLDRLVVIGGYNSSNTTHLVEIGEKVLPTYFVRNADNLISADEIRHFDLVLKEETVATGWLPSQDAPATIGVTAGASCPNNLIEETIRRILKLRGEPV
ncbi:MAG: 4-hydroxy-3-methylbut-2-enyl diphosphate reductase [Terrimicrobiaceae bacterium]